MATPTLRCATLAVLVTCLWSCSTWQVPTVGPEQLIAQDHPGRVRVTLGDSSTVDLEEPRIVGDSIVGLVRGPRTRASRGGQHQMIETSVALDDVAYVEVHKTDISRSVSLVVGVAVGYIVLMLGVYYVSCIASPCT